MSLSFSIHGQQLAVLVTSLIPPATLSDLVGIVIENLNPKKKNLYFFFFCKIASVHSLHLFIIIFSFFLIRSEIKG